MVAVGCAQWQVEIRDSPHLPTETDPVDITRFVTEGALDWELENVPSASVTLDCCRTGFPGLELFTPRMREIWFTREGDSEPSFVGPILRRFAADEVVLGAVGRTWWWLNRRRLRAFTGDATAAAVSMFEDAETQGRIGLTLDTRFTSRSYTVTNQIIESDVSSSAVRWAERGLLLQIGPQPYAVDNRVFTESDWVTPPGVLTDGTDFFTDTIGDTRTVSDPSTVWGRTAETVNDTDIEGWRADHQSGWSNGRGPVVLVSTGTRADDGLTNSLKQGVELDWALFRPGAVANVAVQTRCGAVLGNADAPVQVEIRTVSVDITSGGVENGVAFDAKAFVA